jgi:tetratricopeptide (TPR) repeat protein
LIGHDDERAVQIAEAVIARRPDGPTEVAALMIAADGWRRRGGRDEAADYYRQAAEHPMGQAFAEEATLRRATLLTELGQDRRALELLEQAQLRFGAQGNLSPERSAATARLQLAQGRPADAALTLSRETGADRVLEEPRVLVAEALLERDPSTARALVERVVSGTLAERAARIRAHTKNNRGLK